MEFMKKFILLPLLAVLFFTMNISGAKAQISGAAGPVKNHLISVTINPTYALTATSSTNAYNFSTATQLTNGITTIGAVSLDYSANALTKIMVNASTANFAGGSGSNPMPSTVLTITNGVNTAALTTTPQAIATSLPKGTGTVSIDYKITPGLTYDAAADYAISLVYTLTSN